MTPLETLRAERLHHPHTTRATQRDHDLRETIATLAKMLTDHDRATGLTGRRTPR